MDTRDILNISLTLVSLTFAVCFVYITIYFVKTLQSINQTAQNISETTESIKENMQLKALTSLPSLVISLIGKIIRRKGGEKHGR